MSIPNSRDTLKDWCLRQLGFPVIEVNVDDDQVDDAIDSALQYYQDFHFDGVERWYYSHQITDTDKQNKYIQLNDSDKIIGITRIFPLGSTNASVNMFDLRYQLRLHELYDFTSASYINCDASGGAVTINLPAATGTGRIITIKKTDSSSNACATSPISA